MAGRRRAHFMAFSSGPAGRARYRAVLQPGAQILGHGLGTGVALPWVLFQALQADHLQVARHAGVEFPRRRGRLFLDLRQRVDHAVAGEGGLAGQKRVEDRSQSIDVGGGGDRPAAADGLLGRHVSWGAQDDSAGGHLGVRLDPLGQSEVGDLAVALGVDQDVGRLEVAVENAPHVGVMYRLGHLGEQGGRGRWVIFVGRQPLGQAAAADELHGEVFLSVILTDLVDRYDTGMVQQCDRLGLVLEPAELIVAGENAGPDHLEGDGSVEADLAGLVHDPHAAAAQDFSDLVVAEVADSGTARPAGHLRRNRRTGSSRRGRSTRRWWRPPRSRLSWRQRWLPLPAWRPPGARHRSEG